jgi:hypothetical protein
LIKTIKYSRFLDKMKFRGDEPLSGLNSLYNNVWNTWNWWCLTFGGIFSSINLDSSFIDVILLTNLIFLASKLEVPTLNIIWSFLHDHDFKEITKIVNKQIDTNFDRRKNFAEISNNLLLSNRSRIHWISVLYVISWQIKKPKLQSRI